MVRKIYYTRFANRRLHHFMPALGYNTPRIPLSNHLVSGPTKGPDYEVVKVVRTEGCPHLKGRRVLITWGLNLPPTKWPKVKQVIAVPVEVKNPEYAEILLAC